MPILNHQHRLLVLQIFFLLFLSPHIVVPGSPAAGKFSDVLANGRNVSDGDVLVSAGGSFTLGFFSPAGSGAAQPATRSRRYLGIWFSISPEAVHWVANRDRALNDTSGALKMSDAGVLLLLDGAGKVVWSSSSSSSAGSSSSSTAQLLESGNLVVHVQGSGSGSGTALWQSFDYPCNTLLPGMKIGKNRWTGAEWYLLSWRTAVDPFPGKYRYVTDADGALPENDLLDGNDTKMYRTGVWNGKRFNGVPEMARCTSSFADMFSFQLTVSPGEVTYSYVAKAGSPFSRVVVTDDGVVRRLMWDAATRAWKTLFQAPGDSCDSYAKCGAFGLCDSNAGATSICRCVKGFSPVSPAACSMREFSGGCRRNVALDCVNGSGTDGFEVLHGVKLPDTHNASLDMGVKLGECKVRCLANCSCVAYAAADFSGSGCIIWTNPFVDLRFVDDGQDIYLRLASSEIEDGTGTHVLDDIPSVGYYTIKDATGTFAKNRIIGEGNFGTVYKMRIADDSSKHCGKGPEKNRL
uniref:non-specific serine/threonine protein kinase n=1 Tax=Oryza glumipatula TaxID=40148 RepID=A0A0E0BR07_9ORYZ